jgi:hypothetical protein
MKRHLVALIKPLVPESAARKRARLARERFLRTVFYQGLNPLNAMETRRPTYTPEVNCDDTLKSFVSLLRMSFRQYGS